MRRLTLLNYHTEPDSEYPQFRRLDYKYACFLEQRTFFGKQLLSKLLWVSKKGSAPWMNKGEPVSQQLSEEIGKCLAS